MTRILALDASTVAAGWSLFDGGDYRASGVYVPHGSDWRERVKGIVYWLTDKVYTVGPDVLAYEIASGDRRNMATNRKLGAVEWACWSVADHWDVRWLPVNAMQVKASGCHKEALPVAKDIAGRALDARHAGDEADAIGVGLAAVALLKIENWKGEHTK